MRYCLPVAGLELMTDDRRRKATSFLMIPMRAVSDQRSDFLRVDTFGASNLAYTSVHRLRLA